MQSTEVLIIFLYLTFFSRAMLNPHLKYLKFKSFAFKCLRKQKKRRNQIIKIKIRKKNVTACVI